MRTCEWWSEPLPACHAAAGEPSHHSGDCTSVGLENVTGRDRSGICHRDRSADWMSRLLAAPAAAARVHTAIPLREYPVLMSGTGTFVWAAVGTRRGSRNWRTIGGKPSTCFSTGPNLQRHRVQQVRRNRAPWPLSRRDPVDDSCISQGVRSQATLPGGVRDRIPRTAVDAVLFSFPRTRAPKAYSVGRWGVRVM